MSKARAQEESGAKAHLAQALRWLPGTEAELAGILASGIGMAAPVLLAAALGHLGAGLAAAFGALAAGRLAMGSSIKEQAWNIVAALAPVAAASVAAALIAGRGWRTDALVVVMAGAAAVLGGYSRPLAGATTRFIPVLVIAAAVVDGVSDRAGYLLLMAAGAAWTALLYLVLGALFRAGGRLGPGADAATPSNATRAQRFRRWKRSLSGFAGWQYALRFGSCLALAGGLRWLWPDHHLHWIALTVALLCQRQPEAFSIKTTQRALGTAVGVLVAGTLVAFRPPAWGVVAGIALLAAARPLLRARNYLLYSAIMTPLIILIMDAGRPPDVGVLVDRLVATLVGAGLVVAADAIAARLLRPGEA
ncbi:MAG TPA: FUSC family protein [Burkholderiales bacterium]|nr:FUSC family protein [Burkholderiales bacterium]